MSDHLPLEMQLEIMKRLPVKSLVQFRSVSKGWCSLITSSDFIGRYSAHHTHIQHLLVTYDNDIVDYKKNFVLFIDNVTFPKHKVSLVPPMLLKMFKASVKLIGCSDGLLCIFGVSSINRKVTCVIWNIAIRKEVAVVLHNNVGEQKKYTCGLGFGVCRETNDPMIVEITHGRTMGKDAESLADIPCQVEVFKLSTGGWRSLDSSNLSPRISTGYDSLQVERCLYWLTIEIIPLNGENTSYNLIISFDMKSEEFKQVKLPDTLADKPWSILLMSKLRESLVVLELVGMATSIWRMEGGVLNTFTKLFTLNDYGDPSALLRGFRNNGEPIVEIVEDDIGPLDIYKLAVYDPYSKHFNSLGIDGSKSTFSVQPYKETLLMLDQPNLKVYNQLESLKI